MEDTIFALASARGKAGIAVVRLSGPESVSILGALGGVAPTGRGMRLCLLKDASGETLDQALVLSFEEGASFTGESVVELQLHGSMAVVRSVLRAIEATGLARPSEPGEFTRRALLNDRIDLTQVQGLGALIDAETEAQRRQAMRILSGEMSRKVEHWRKHLIRSIALLEATIDFADEDIPEDVLPEVAYLLGTVSASIQQEIDGAGLATRIRSGFEVALVGPPNVGKSSLLNRLTRSDAALVSGVAGTTRDVIEVRMDLHGLPVTILDMAGLRETSDCIESLGVSRARMRASSADLRIFLSEDAGREFLGVAQEPDDLVRRTKIDLGGGEGISALTGAGIDQLLKDIAIVLGARLADAGLASSDRDISAMQLTVDQIGMVARSLDKLDPEILVTMLREAILRLGTLIGVVDIETVLDEIFASFCLGK